MAANTPLFVDLGFARVDTDRRRRVGFPEVIFCQSKTPAEVAAIAATLLEHEPVMLATRANAEHFQAVSAQIPDAVFHARASCITVERTPMPRPTGVVGVLCAGTSDLPVAEEAAVTLEIFGHPARRFYDVGVAGLHRLLAVRDELERAACWSWWPGWKARLPSVVAGLVSCPVIAVPTSVGYGASFGGLTALLAMLNSCASGVTVVNIDNGFGAAYAAATINRRIA